MTPAHVSVLPAEVVHFLAPERGGLFVDCTIGLGGHTQLLLEAGASRVLGFDRDASALSLARTRLSSWGDRVEFVHADYRTLPAELQRRGIAAVDGVLADLGVSSMQLDSEGRGFSFQRDEPLDMRMDRSTGPTAADLLATIGEGELADIIYTYGEERYSRRIARAVVEARHDAPILTTGHLASIVRRAVPGRGYQRIDPATRTFQAIRIWVNEELGGLDRCIEALVQALRVGARLVVISFHSLEDRVAKHTLRALAAGDAPSVRILTKRPVTATESEVSINPRARSAKLRAAERVA